MKAAREKIVARTDDDRNEFLRKRGFSRAETVKIIETVLAEERRKPESVFDFVQGITAVPSGPGETNLESVIKPSSLVPAMLLIATQKYYSSEL